MHNHVLVCEIVVKTNQNILKDGISSMHVDQRASNKIYLLSQKKGELEHLVNELTSLLNYKWLEILFTGVLNSTDAIRTD